MILSHVYVHLPSINLQFLLFAGQFDPKHSDINESETGLGNYMQQADR